MGATRVTLHYTAFDTDFGWVAIVSSEDGLLRLTLPHPTADGALASLTPLPSQPVTATSFFGDLPYRLQRYFGGQKVDFPDKLDLSWATPFQGAVWRLNCSVPYGETRTYGWIAKKLERPQSARAVGQAMARNHFPIVVPCHRVVGSDGSLVGFGGGLAMKRRLLALESSVSR